MTLEGGIILEAAKLLPLELKWFSVLCPKTFQQGQGGLLTIGFRLIPDKHQISL